VHKYFFSQIITPEDKICISMNFYIVDAGPDVKKKIECFGGTIIAHIDEVTEPEETVAVVQNNISFSYRLAMARSREMVCVTPDFIHHSCYFKRVMTKHWYVPTFYQFEGLRCEVHFAGRPFEFRNILVLSDSVNAFLRIRYLLKQAGAYVYFGIKYVKWFEEHNNLGLEFDFTVCLNEVSKETIKVLKQMDATPVYEQFILDSIILGEVVDCFEPRFYYMPEIYSELTDDEEN